MSCGTTGHGGERLTVHQLIRTLAPAYQKRFDARMPARHRQVLNTILSCRTPARGGQLFQCPDCAAFHYRYYSCNDRHCPQCGQTDADDWLERQRARLLLPVPFFLITFTVPEALRRFLRSNQLIGLNLLFGASAQALQDLAANPRRLGAQLGMLGVLHTWSRTLIYHPHIHYLVPGGGLSPDGREWISAKNNFLLHHAALGARLCTLFKERLLKQHPQLFSQVPAKVWKAPWNVGCAAVASGENALRYLSRYLFKTATANRTVQLLPEGTVCWPYRDSTTGKQTAIKLAALDWMGRLLQHILPRHFARVRSFGWLHPAARRQLNRVRALLGQSPLLTQAELQTWTPTPDPDDALQDPSPGDPQSSTSANSHSPLCPHCRRAMILIGTWRPGQPLLSAPSGIAALRSVDKRPP